MCRLPVCVMDVACQLLMLAQLICGELEYCLLDQVATDSLLSLLCQLFLSLPDVLRLLQWLSERKYPEERVRPIAYCKLAVY